MAPLLHLSFCRELRGPDASVHRGSSTDGNDDKEADSRLMGALSKGCFRRLWVEVDKRLVAAFDFGGFGLGVTEPRRRSSSVSSKSSGTSESWSSVSLTSGGFYPTLAWHPGYRVEAYQWRRWGPGRTVSGFSILILASRRKDSFLFVPIFLGLEQSRRSAGGIGFGHSIAPGSPSVSCRHLEGNAWGVLKESQQR